MQRWMSWCAAFFFTIERVATATSRRKIDTHPLRPEVVDEMHVEAEAEALKQAAEQEPTGEAKARAGKASDESGAGEAS